LGGHWVGIRGGSGRGATRERGGHVRDVVEGDSVEMASAGLGVVLGEL
jgi:hypothetical protein